MTDVENTSVSTEIEVPLAGVAHSDHQARRRVFLTSSPSSTQAMKDTETAKKVAAYLKKPKDGFYHEGSAIDDKIAVTEIIVDYDTKHGAAIINSGLNNKQKRDSVFVVLRQYYELDRRHGKYDWHQYQALLAAEVIDWWGRPGHPFFMENNMTTWEQVRDEWKEIEQLAVQTDQMHAQTDEVKQQAVLERPRSVRC